MRYIIDGYNLLFQRPCYIDNFTEDRSRLIEEIVELSSYHQMDMRIVFDAHCRQEDGSLSHKGSVAIIYTDHKQTADECIVQFVSHDENPRSLCVVTSDRQLAHRCRCHLCQIMTCDKFISFLTEKKRRGRKRDNYKTKKEKEGIFHDPEMQRWLKLFTKKNGA